jgi:hypothetical protein
VLDVTIKIVALTVKIIRGNWLYVLRAAVDCTEVKEKSISLFGTEEKSGLKELRLKWISIMGRSSTRMAYGPKNDTLFGPNKETCGPIDQPQYIHFLCDWPAKIYDTSFPYPPFCIILDHVLLTTSNVSAWNLTVLLCLFRNRIMIYSYEMLHAVSSDIVQYCRWTRMCSVFVEYPSWSEDHWLTSVESLSPHINCISTVRMFI